MKKVFDGYHATILCYGQTTSGKTYTTLGEPRNPGLIPCALRDIFQSELNVSISYIQIYNEQIDDLLTDETKNPKIIDDQQWGTLV